MKADRFGPAALAATACLIFSIFVITLGRVPTPWPDAQLYASIARSLQLHGNGVPSTIWFSPVAVDHLPFYGRSIQTHRCRSASSGSQSRAQGLPACSECCSRLQAWRCWLAP